MVQEASPSQHRHHLILSREQQLKTKQLMSSYRRHFFHNVAPLSSHSILIYFRTRIQKNDWFALELLKIICEADVDVSGQFWRSGLPALLHRSDQRVQVAAQPGGGL